MNGIPLNINLQQILLHLLNFAILFTALYFILYKPVKDFMDKRKKIYIDMDEDAKRKLDEAEAKVDEYNEKIKNVNAEAKAIKEKATKDAMEAGKKIISDAESEANDILKKARVDSERERDELLKLAEKEIKDMVTTGAEKVLFEKSTSDAFDEFIKETKNSL